MGLTQNYAFTGKRSASFGVSAFFNGTEPEALIFAAWNT
jgi:hypothetical protein